MAKLKIYLITGLIFLTLNFPGCGQKGPLYLDDTPDRTEKRVKPDDEKRRKELEGLQPRNDSQPGITY